MSQFENKVSIVTGANSGIGRATAKLLAQRGSKVVVAARREAEGLAVVKRITDAGGQAIFVRTDVAVESDVQNLVQQTLATYGQIDVAFLNSGVFRPAPITDPISSSRHRGVIGLPTTIKVAFRREARLNISWTMSWP